MGKSITDLSSVTTVGLDLAKHVFQVHGVDASGRVVVAKAMRRNSVGILRFAAALSGGARGLRLGASLGARADHARPRGAHDASGLCEAVYSPAEERRGRRGGDLRGCDSAFDAICRRTFAGEPGSADAAQGARDVGCSANAIAERVARTLDRDRRDRGAGAQTRPRTG